MRFRNPYVIAGTATAVFLLVSWAGRNVLDHHEGTAAWIQAIGSIAAIVAAAMIASANFTDERERERKKTQQLKESVVVLARHCLNRIDYLIGQQKPGYDPRHGVEQFYTPSDIEGPLDGLAAIPLHDLGDAVLIGAVLDLRREMGRVKARMDAVKALEGQSGTPAMINVMDLLNWRTVIFNAVANVMRSVSPGTATENELSKWAAIAKHPTS